MKEIASRSAPTVIVVVVLCISIWQYVGSPAPAATTPAVTPPEISAAMLSPSFGPAPERDPFGMPADKAEKAADTEQSAIADSKGQGKKGKKAKSEPEPPPIVDTDPREGLILSATFLHGNRTLAIINGRVIAKGETVKLAMPSTAPCHLAEIHHHRVLLERGGQTFELSYLSPSSPGRGDRGSLAAQTPQTATRKGAGAGPGASPPHSPAGNRRRSRRTG